MKALSYCKAASNKVQERYIGVVNYAAPKIETKTTNVLEFLFRATLASLYLSICFTCLIMAKKSVLG